MVVLVHTEVDPAFAGQGLGDGWSPAPWRIRARGLKLVPLCPFVRSYLRRHPDQADLVAGGRPSQVTMDGPPGDDRLGRAYAAPEVTVFYDRGRCRHYAECVRGLPQVFDPTRRPWIRADLADAQAVAEIVRRCPTDPPLPLLAAEPEEPTSPTTITTDSRGPLLVRGEVVLDTPGGHCVRPGLRCAPVARTQNNLLSGACGARQPQSLPWTSRTARTARAARR